MSESVRIDKWLWAARFFKTRSMATDAVDGGKIRLNGERIKPARGVKIGDKLDIDNGSTEWEVVVDGLAELHQLALVGGAPGATAAGLVGDPGALGQHRTGEAHDPFEAHLVDDGQVLG